MARQRSYQLLLPDLVRIRANADRERGVAWIEGLDECVAALQREWNLQLGDVLSGGSESLVIRAICKENENAILKISVPGSKSLAESKVLQLADGNGYAKLFAVDRSRNAMLLEELGSPLCETVTSIDQFIREMCATLKTAWLRVEGAHGWRTGADKARGLGDLIVEKWQALEKPCTEAIIHHACAFVEERIDAFSPEDCVLVHGDAHGRNALRWKDGRCKFVDPDGLFAERACDLAYLMRDCSAELLNGNTVNLARQRCELLAELCEVDESSIWQWGFIERVSIGLILIENGMGREGQETLDVADRLTNV